MLTVQMSKGRSKSKKPTKKAESPFADLMNEMNQVFSESDLPKVTLQPLKKTTQSTLLSPAQEMFLQVIQHHLRPVCRYLKAIRRGVQSKLLLEITDLILEQVMNHTLEVSLKSHAAALDNFRGVAQEVIGASAKAITPQQAGALGGAFSPVEQLYKLSLRGHSVAVLNLVQFYKRLKAIDGITSREIRQLFSIGIPCMTMLRKMSIEELVSLSGLEMKRAAEIRHTAREFELAWALD
jgi:hypothetical protein